MIEQNKEQVLEIDTNQLESLMSGSDVLPPIEIPLEWYDTKEFHRGIQETSYLAGTITALLNVGVDQNFVLDYLLNQATIEHNLKTAQINKETSIEVSKNAKVTQDKYEL